MKLDYYENEVFTLTSGNTVELKFRSQKDIDAVNMENLYNRLYDDITNNGGGGGGEE